MAVATSRFLAPATLSAIHDLRLVASIVVEGFLSGEHKDLRPGAGVEFQQYRGYEPGDDPRRLDWKLFARSGRFFIRESEVERDVIVRVIVDASASMAYAEDGISKLDYARFLAASLAFLADRQGDRVALHLLAGGGSVEVPVSLRGSTLPRILHRLERAFADGGLPNLYREGNGCFNTREREIVVLISDLYEEDDELSRSVDTWSALGHELIVLQIMGRQELEWPWQGDFEFEDLESARTLRGNAATLARDYRRRLGEFLTRWRSRIAGLGQTYELFTLDRPLDDALRHFLLRRRGAG
ncbi:MAG: DUF58 domain-containing protein [Thermoanaerobaculia bacterium]